MTEKKLPIPDVPMKQQKPIIELVDKILALKQANPQSDIADLENQVDYLVFRCYIKE